MKPLSSSLSFTLSLSLISLSLSARQNFYKTELNKEEMYIRYIHKLYDLHLKAQNYTGEPVGTSSCTPHRSGPTAAVSLKINSIPKRLYWHGLKVGVVWLKHIDRGMYRRDASGEGDLHLMHWDGRSGDSGHLRKSYRK